MIDERPANGGGSCPRCLGELGLAALKLKGTWYCSSGCARGEVSAEPRDAGVPEEWLYNRPRRHYRQRGPKELRSTRPGS